MTYSAPASGGTTGRYLVLLPDTDDPTPSLRTLSDVTGLRGVARAADFERHRFSTSALASAEVAVFDDLGVALARLDPDQLQSVRAVVARRQMLQGVEPERVVYALPEPRPFAGGGLSAEYLLGYRDSVNHLVDQALAAAGPAVAAFTDAATTWGLQATGTPTSPYTGLGMRVAVLDTGVDLNHPDFAGRTLIAESFIDGESVQDENGHGTHCIGTACGPQQPDAPPRYGVAYNADIYAGKVLSNTGSGSDGTVLAGMEWAVASGCEVISMSLGSATREGDSFSQVYNQVGFRALRRGSLIVAAAGNESNRPRRVSPVGSPANAPTIMAVGALDSQLQVASFSNSSINPMGGKVDLVAPGVEVYSTWPTPTGYNTISGTSMATPHVAGLAALHAEASGERGLALWGLLLQAAQRLDLPVADVGAGLAQAPQ